MDDKELGALLSPYNPWWYSGNRWESLLPDFQRPVVDAIIADLSELPQMVSITGPRRVGKSTAVRHVVSRLIRQGGVRPEALLLPGRSCVGGIFTRSAGDYRLVGQSYANGRSASGLRFLGRGSTVAAMGTLLEEVL